jgi:ubiquinone/menaquinone biosynthesis C-methylase UbiE
LVSVGDERAARASSGHAGERRRVMSRPVQTPASIQSDFDRIAPASDEGWNHNARYHEYLLSHVPERCGRVLEIGCGAGAFARLLARRAESVLAIDLSPRMIRLARERSEAYTNVEFVNGDVAAFQFTDEQFDCVATLATLHHLPAEEILSKVRRALKPGGVFLCLDLYRRSDLTDLLFDCAAYPSSLLLRLLKTGKPRPPKQVRDAYAAHGKTDTLLTLPQAERVCADTLPGALLRRHLFWRYSVVWKKEAHGTPFTVDTLRP